MEHMAWKGRIKPGCKAEYQRRHAEIWPEMVKVLKEAGICNYSIFYCKDELFGYYECEKGVAYAEKVQAESTTVSVWVLSTSPLPRFSLMQYQMTLFLA